MAPSQRREDKRHLGDAGKRRASEGCLTGVGPFPLLPFCSVLLLCNVQQPILETLFYPRNLFKDSQAVKC